MEFSRDIFYILDDRVPKSVDDFVKWSMWFWSNNQRVDSTIIGDVHISTVFLGIDTSPFGEPKLFETMVFGGKHHGYQRRCSTWEQAAAQHVEAVALITGELQ